MFDDATLDTLKNFRVSGPVHGSRPTTIDAPVAVTGLTGSAGTKPALLTIPPRRHRRAE